MRKPVLLFITRKWDGHGGMQQLSRDLWRGMQETYGECARLCIQTQSPFFVTRYSLLVTFVGRAVVLGVIAVWRGGHVHLGDAALAPFGWFLKKVGRGRVTITVCGLDVIWPRWWYQWLLRGTLPYLDRVVCISRATAEEVRRRGVSEEKIVVIPCGVWGPCHGEVPRDTAGPRTITAPTLLTIGRLVARKGVLWFVREVVPILLRDLPHLQYWIVGSGSQELLIKKFVQEKGLEHCVHLLGELDDARREECFALADLLVVPNIPVTGDMEGFGIVCIEASARGIPVVAARCGGLSDAVIEGETGRFFTSGDAGDCARVVKEVLGHFDRFSVTRNAVARATLEHYGWPRLFRRYHDEVFRF